MFAVPLPRRRNQPLPADGAAGTAPGSAYRWETAAAAQTTKAAAAALKPTKACDQSFPEAPLLICAICRIVRVKGRLTPQAAFTAAFTAEIHIRRT